jgi:pyruvate dehydrogenase E2 component (dihydrolipoamide acetyltransferase)
MATPIRMPALGQTSDELTLVTWLVSEGEHVTEGAPLFEVDTDKATLEVEAATAGTLLMTLCEPGQTVVAGTVLGWIGESGEAIPVAQPVADEVRALADQSPTISPPTTTPRRGVPAQRLAATPAARALARERGVELAEVTGSGPDGRIERRDVLEAIETASITIEVREDEEPVPAHRQAIARRLVRTTSVPQFSVSRTVDARRAVARAAEADGVTITHLLLQAVAAALRAVPSLNRVWIDDGPRYRHLKRSDVGLAIAGEDSLIVARIPEPDQLSLDELVTTTRQAVDQGRAGRLTQAFSGQVAVTISNLGMFAIDRFEAIVDPDQAAILAVGRVAERPAVTDDGIVAMLQLDLTLTVDHRSADGADAARFLGAICAHLENDG